MSKLALAVSAGLALTAAASARPLFNGPGQAIPDAAPGTPSVINVAPSFTVSGVSLSFQGLSHTWVGDVSMTLAHGATTFTFYDRPGVPASTFGNSDDFGGANSYGWADGGIAFPEATGSGSTASIVNSGTYAPGQANGGIGATFASAFAGQNSAGAWTLTVADSAGGDTGQYNGWTLNLVPTPGAAALFGVAGLAGIRRRR